MLLGVRQPEDARRAVARAARVAAARTARRRSRRGRAARARARPRGPSRPRRRRRPSRCLRQHRVGEPRPRLERPRVELAVGEARAARGRPSGSIQRNVPLPPKWPNVRAELRVPVQCGCFASRNSTPRPQSFGSKRPTSGRTPPRPGNCTDVISASVSGATSVGDWSSRASATRSSSVPWIAGAGEPRSSARMPSGSKTAGAEVVGERHLGGALDVRGELLEARCSSRCGAVPGGAIGLSPSNGSPDACASRWRTVEPSGPAGSSRSTTPSSAATSVASATAGFVIDAQRELRRRAARATATTSPPRSTATATTPAPQPSTCRQRLHAARY